MITFGWRCRKVTRRAISHILFERRNFTFTAFYLTLDIVFICREVGSDGVITDSFVLEGVRLIFASIAPLTEGVAIFFGYRYCYILVERNRVAARYRALRIEFWFGSEVISVGFENGVERNIARHIHVVGAVFVVISRIFPAHKGITRFFGYYQIGPATKFYGRITRGNRTHLAIVIDFYRIIRWDKNGINSSVARRNGVGVRIFRFRFAIAPTAEFVARIRRCFQFYRCLKIVFFLINSDAILRNAT